MEVEFGSRLEDGERRIAEAGYFAGIAEVSTGNGCPKER